MAHAAANAAQSGRARRFRLTFIFRVSCLGSRRAGRRTDWTVITTRRPSTSASPGSDVPHDAPAAVSGLPPPSGGAGALSGWNYAPVSGVAADEPAAPDDP